MAIITPSLLTLCFGTLNTHILFGDDDDDGIFQGIYELPSELFDCLLNKLPALALHKLQLQMPSDFQIDFYVDYDCSGNGNKRARFGKFDIAWKALFCSRWADLGKKFQVNSVPRKLVWDCEAICDWQQKYWELHLQYCFDAAAERAMLPSFDGHVGEIQIPDAFMKIIGEEGPGKGSMHTHSRLRYHCENFGCYMRSVRLQNIFCNKETCHLLANSKLQALYLRRISSDVHLDGLRMILNQNKETMRILEFMNCKVSLAFLEAISYALEMKGIQAHALKHFSVKASKLLEANPNFLPPKLVSLLSSR